MENKPRKRRRRKKWLTWLIVLAVAAGGFIGYGYYQAKSFVPVAAASYEGLRVERGDIELLVGATGSVASASVRDVVSRVSGTIVSVGVELGDPIREGEQLLVLTDTNMESAIRTAESSLEQSRINLSKTYVTTSADHYQITAPETGRIKSLKAAPGEDAGQTTKTFGALCLIMTEGKMQFTVQAAPNKLNIGDQAAVLVDGVMYMGEVISASGGNAASGSTQNYSGNLTASTMTNAQPTPIPNPTPTPPPWKGNITIQIYTDEPNIGDIATFIGPDGLTWGSGELSIAPGASVSVTATSGKIRDIMCANDMSVTRGDVLFRIQQAEDVSLGIKSQKLSIEEAERSLEDKRKQLSDTQAGVSAPIGGVVTSLPVKAGGKLAEGTVICTITDDRLLDVKVDVDELDVVNIEKGQPCTVTLDALPGETFSGAVQKVASIGTYANGIATYNVTVRLDEAPRVRIGMSASVDIRVKHAGNALLVPIEALVQRGGAYYVYTQDLSDLELQEAQAAHTGRSGLSGSISAMQQRQAQQMGLVGNNANSGSSSSVPRKDDQGLTKVEVGIQNETQAQILSGLNEGQPVYLRLPNAGAAPGNAGGMFVMGGNLPSNMGGQQRPQSTPSR